MDETMPMLGMAPMVGAEEQPYTTIGAPDAMPLQEPMFNVMGSPDSPQPMVYNTMAAPRPPMPYERNVQQQVPPAQQPQLPPQLMQLLKQFPHFAQYLAPNFAQQFGPSRPQVQPMRPPVQPIRPPVQPSQPVQTMPVQPIRPPVQPAQPIRPQPQLQPAVQNALRLAQSRFGRR